MGERIESMNAKPPMFQAGISNKFTKRHVDNFHDTTLTAASAAKQRAERRAEKQAEAIDKQQKKIESEMRKIEEITQRLHRQQVREAKRLRNRLHYAATRIQRTFRESQRRWRAAQSAAAIRIQCSWRCVRARARANAKREERHERTVNRAATVITRHVQGYACRLAFERMLIGRAYAATLIQSVARMAHARCAYVRLQHEQRAAHAQYAAAVRIQSHVRSFMTRLIYLDVLYVIARIQAVVRGFLIRRRLQWLAAIDIESIVKFQALARGYLTRQQLQRDAWASDGSGGSSSSSADALRRGAEPHDNDSDDTSPSTRESDVDSALTHSQRRYSGTSTSVLDVKRAKRKATKTQVLPSTLVAHQPEVVFKRSYWLPAGASFNKRLPVLPVKRTAVLGDSESDGEDDLAGVLAPDPSLLLHAARTPKKRNQRNRPVRLAPVVLPLSTHSGASARSGRLGAETESEQQRDVDDRAKREEELKQKLLSRKLVEKRRVELEQQLKRAQEMEESERKLMEREEKLARLLLKVLHRRHKEGRIKKQSAEQQREERERIAMARAERQTRLVLKLAMRHAQAKKPATTTATSSGTSSSGPVQTRVRGSKSRTELHAAGSSDNVSGKQATRVDPHDDDDDMSFLDIDFKIPVAMQSTKRTHGCSSKTTKRAARKATSKRSDARSTLSHCVATTESSSSNNNNNQDEVSAIHDSVPKALDDRRSAIDDDDAFDYGSEFEEIVDEAKLARLIC